MILQNGKGLLHMEMGTGKTATAIAVAGGLQTRNLIDEVLVICPVNALGVWKKELEIWWTGSCTLFHVRSSKQTIKTDIPEKCVNQPHLTCTLITPDLAARLNYQKNDRCLIIWDEIQKIKGASTKRSKYAEKLALSTPYKIGLSGTPAPQGPLDYFGIFRFIDSTLWPMTWTKFKGIYADWLPMPRQYIRTKYKNLDELKERVASLTFNIRKADCLDLPSKVRQIIPVNLSPEENRIYIELEHDFITSLEDGEYILADHILTRLIRLSQVTGGFVHDSHGEIKKVGESKLLILKSLIQPLIEAGDRITIFARFKAEVTAIEKELTPLLSVHTIRGGDSDSKRQKALDAYAKSSPGALICSLGAASEAINLSHSAYTIFFSLDFDLSHVEQADARNDRPGQTRPMTTYFLLTDDTIDTYMYRAVVEKRRMQDWIGGFIDSRKD